MSFWDVVWFIMISFALGAYLIALFKIVADLVKDPEASGFTKGAWVIALIFFPFLAGVVYLIVRGQGMAERQFHSASELNALAGQDRHFAVVGSSPASGAIPTTDYERFKTRPLA